MQPANKRAETAVALVVLSGRLSSDELAALIGIAPDKSWERGDPIGRTRRARQPYAGWEINAGAATSAEVQVERVLSRVNDRRESIAALARDPRVHSVSLWIWASGESFGIELSSELMTRIVRMGASLKIDAYDLDPSSSAAPLPHVH